MGDAAIESEAQWKAAAACLPIGGGTSLAELKFLFVLASRARHNCIVEIGSYVGRSTIALAHGSMSGHGVAVYAVEPHEAVRGALGVEFGPQDRTAFFQNLLRAEATEVVRPVGLPSLAVARMWNRSVAILFIDGDHHYDAVRADFDAWSPHVVRGGVIVFHDAFNPNIGVHRVVNEVLSDNGYEKHCDVDKICAVRKL